MSMTEGASSTSSSEGMNADSASDAWQHEGSSNRLNVVLDLKTSFLVKSAAGKL
jgi:hypothetical protein